MGSTMMDADANDGGFYPQPRYAAFERASGITYKAYVDAAVTAALVQPRIRYRQEFAALVAEPHYEFKLVPSTHPVYETRVHEDSVVAWYRRPLVFARTLPVFPWTSDDELVLIVRDTNAPAIVASIRRYVEQSIGAATGFVELEAHEVRSKFAADVQRSL
jgi:hypothetical protein